MLVGILLLAHRRGSTAFTVDAVQGTGPRAVLIVLLLVLGLAIKLPVFPLHTWLPAAHTIAPTGGSVLLAAVLLKLGSYGLIRLPVLSAPEAFAVIAPWLGLAGGVGVVWGGLVCLAETDLKRLIAYSSVAHMGFVALAVSTGSQLGIQAAIYSSIAHGLKHRWGSASLTVAREPLREVSPRLGAILVLGLTASMGLPGLAGFWGELLTLVAAWSPAPGRPRSVFVASAIIAAVGAALAAAYVVRVLRLVWLGDAVAGQRGRPIVRVDIRGVEWAVTAVLVAGIVWLGVYPYVLLDLTVVAPAGPAVAP
jgi:NADH-quinone oxidoreductase subunit M